MNDVGRDAWTIQDYMEELFHCHEMDEMPWIPKRIEMLKDEMKQKFSTKDLLDNGFTLEDFKR